jgi:hypothetical protein
LSKIDWELTVAARLTDSKMSKNCFIVTQKYSKNLPGKGRVTSFENYNIKPQGFFAFLNSFPDYSEKAGPFLFTYLANQGRTLHLGLHVIVHILSKSHIPVST